MKKLLVAVLALCMTPMALAVYSPLDEFVVLLQEAQAVDVHQREDDSVLFSWPAPASRRIDSKTVAILLELSEFSQKHPGLFVHFTVTADGTEQNRQELQNTLDYKADKLRETLQKKAAESSQIYAIGVANQHAGNRIFAAVEFHHDASRPLTVALPKQQPASE